MNQPVSVAAPPSAFLDLLKEGVMLVEANGVIVYSNQAAQKLLGLTYPAVSLAELFAQVAPTSTWQHLLDAPAEAYLYTVAAHLHIEAQPVVWEEQRLIQLLLSPTAAPETTAASGKLMSEQLAALARISQHLSATLRLDNVLQAVNDEALRHTNADGCQISLFDETYERFMPHIEQGKFTLSPTNKQIAVVNQSRQAVIFNNLTVGTVQSALLTPILFENAVAGLIFLYSGERERFNEQSRIFVSALANHAAIAIGNTQRFNELEKRTTLLHQRAQQIERFVESSRVFHGDRPQDEVYEDLVYAIQEGVGYSVVMLSLVDESDSQRKLRRIAAAGLPLARLREMQKVRQPWSAIEKLLQPKYKLGAAYFIPADTVDPNREKVDVSRMGNLFMPSGEETTGGIYRVTMLGENERLDVHMAPTGESDVVGSIPYNGMDVQAIGKAETVGSMTWLPVRYRKIQGWVNQAFLEEERDAARWHENDLFVIPLLGSRGQPLGLISVDNPNDGRRPTESTAKALEIFANQAATAIENVRLLHNTRAFAGMLQQLHNISQQVLREQDFDQQLQLIVDGISRAGWERISLTLRDHEFSLLKLTTSGLTSEEVADLQANMWPPEKWRDLMQKPELERFRTGGCYFLPGDDEWVVENMSGGWMGRTPPKDDPDSWQPTDALFLPLYDRQQNIMAIINLDDPVDGRRPNDRAMQTIELYTQFATSIIENAQLYQETQRQLAELRTINEVSQAVSTTVELDALTEKIASSMAAAYHIDSYYIALYNAAENHFDYPFIIDEGEAREVSPTPADRGPTNHVFRTGKPLLINSLADWSMLNNEGYDAFSRSYLGVPMRIADEVIGVLAIQDYQNEQVFSQQDVNSLSAIATQVAVAIANARLVSELRELNEQLDERVVERTRALGEERDRVQILLRITTELSTSLDQEHVSGRGLQMVNEFVNATQGGIILIDPESGRLGYRGGFGLDQDQRDSLVSGQTVINKLIKKSLKERQASIVADLTEQPDWNEEETHPIQALSVLAAPLIYGDEVIGIMILFHSEPNAFTPQQLELVSATAAQIANAINNARLYLLIRDQAERLGSMLREEQIEAAKNEAILQSIADGVLVADINGSIILANMPASYILDIPRNQLLKKNIDGLRDLFGGSVNNWVNTIQGWLQDRQSVEQHTHMIDRMEFEEKITSVQLSPVFANNQFIGTVSIFRDITKDVELDRMKSDFVSTVSHELRTPMTSIKGYADLMLMGAAGPMSDPQARYLTVIKNNADRLSMLVNDLLDISRIETGRTELNLRPLDVAQLIKQIVDGHLRGRIQHENKPMDISLEMAPSLPLINADVGRMTQILTNLLDNAFHYTPEEGHITVRAEENGRFVAIHIQDTGIGIAPENVNKIFQRFFRSDDADVQKVAGTGLGLAIVSSLVEMHGGEIEVNSVLGEGSTFTITIPLVRETAEKLRG
jgi:signal transduction histidine kinase